MTAAVYTLEVHGARPLTVNRVASMHRQQWATHTRDTRRAWWLTATELRLPRLQRARIIATPLHADRRSPQDVAACAPEVKAAIDGLVDAAVLPDDSAQHLLSLTFNTPEIVGHNGLRLEIREET